MKLTVVLEVCCYVYIHLHHVFVEMKKPFYAMILYRVEHVY